MLYEVITWLWVPERSARPRGESFGALLHGLAELMRQSAFLRTALCMGASQFAATSLQTLWVATWWRDVAGYAPAEVARGLAALNVAMIAGYIGFGRAADRAAQRGASTLPLFAGGIAVASLCLGLIVAGVRTGSMVLWCVFVLASTAAVSIYSTLSRTYPKTMTGRVITGLNVFGFAGMFLGQWSVGLRITSYNVCYTKLLRESTWTIRSSARWRSGSAWRRT